MRGICRSCFNWKVYGGLGAMTIGVWFAAPHLFWSALPILILAACPISMVLMMHGMQNGRCAAASPGRDQPAHRALSRGEQMMDLRVRLASAQAQHDAVALEIARLETASVPAVRAAEAVAHAAEKRIHRQH